ncbi:MAG: CDP-2,3-bis-(O-geranylgeranyl)-sn-glycerol synthase [Candidatus Thorarchaeota archaeon]
MPKRELNEAEKKHTKIALRLAVFFGCLLLIDFLLISIFFSWQDWVAILLFSLLFIFPGYISNAGMVLVGGGKSIDGGRMFRDGRRILGDNKTWSGLIKGPLYIGIPISIVLFCLFLVMWPVIVEIPITGIKENEYKIYDDIMYYKYYFIGGSFPYGFLALIIRIVLCSYGAAIGDLVGSFLKRRFDIKSGAPFWVIDQLDFVLFAIIITCIPAFIIPNLFWIPDLNIIIFLLILTPSVSIIANTIAYIIGLKEVPW